MTSKHTFEAIFSARSVTLAVVAVFLETYWNGIRRFLAVACLICAATYAAGTFHLIMTGTVAGAMNGVLIALIFGLIISALSCWKNVKYALHEFYKHDSKKVSVEFTESGCAVVCESVSGNLPWEAFLRYSKFGRFVLLKFDLSNQHVSNQDMLANAMDLY